jgi:hypothetical protein
MNLESLEEKYGENQERGEPFLNARVVHKFCEILIRRKFRSIVSYLGVFAKHFEGKNRRKNE